ELLETPTRTELRTISRTVIGTGATSSEHCHVYPRRNSEYGALECGIILVLQLCDLCDGVSVCRRATVEKSESRAVDIGECAGESDRGAGLCVACVPSRVCGALIAVPPNTGEPREVRGNRSRRGAAPYKE